MNKITVCKGDRSSVTIEAPADKKMAIDNSLLQHGCLSIGEYGPSGIKIGVFMDWSHAMFDADEHGYKITNK